MWSSSTSKAQPAIWVENLRQCPYDKCHQIRPERLMIHVLKCRTNYVKKLQGLGLPVEGVKCRYDCSGRFFPPELLGHEEVCELRPPFAGMEDWFDKEMMDAAIKVMKEEKQKALGWKGDNFAKKESTGEEKEGEKKRVGGPRQVADMEWEANDEDDWGKQDTGKIFSLFKPLMPIP